mmetsp:Transcript_116019/g.237230  ORF Transcript_116019/g.237230 Transcript_116019/m.237230 type:complete len:245 (-) Transcript_116019:1175-1909(-)
MAARAVVASAAVVAPRKVALIMGVANQRSIAMSCMESFLQKGDWDVVLTVQNERNRERVQRMVEERNKARSGGTGSTLGAFVCDVTDPGSTGLFFRESLPEALDREGKQLEAVVHSIAFAPDLRNPLLETNREAFLDAHEISAYSLIEVARESLPLFRNNNDDDDDTTNTTEPNTAQRITAQVAVALPLLDTEPFPSNVFGGRCLPRMRRPRGTWRGALAPPSLLWDCVCSLLCPVLFCVCVCV